MNLTDGVLKIFKGQKRKHLGTLWKRRLKNQKWKMKHYNWGHRNKKDYETIMNNYIWAVGQLEEMDDFLETQQPIKAKLRWIRKPQQISNK
jgi:hypothetical protein